MLIFDDDADCLSLLTHFLRNQAFTVTDVRDGNEMFTNLVGRPFDAVLFDEPGKALLRAPYRSSDQA